MSGDQAAAGNEEQFSFVSTPPLDGEELSRQYGSSDSLSHSKYILVEKSPELSLKEHIAEARKRSAWCCSAETEVVTELLTHGQQSVLSCFWNNMDHYINAHQDKAFDVRTFQELQGFNCSHVHQGNYVWSILPQNDWQLCTKDLSAQNVKEHLKLSQGSCVPTGKYRETQWLVTQRLQCTPELHMQNQPHKLHHSRDMRGFSLPEDGQDGVATDQPEKLGEALCHSQTRARNAEKLVNDTQIEREQLAKLLFKEASMCRTYKERVQLLELENMQLKLQSEHEVELPLAYCKAPELKPCCKFYEKRMSKSATSVPGMIGIAFALGLSCASACFMIGCCMGLVGLSQ